MTAPPRVGGSPTIIALEEHWWPPELAAALERLPPDRRDEGLVLFNGGERERRLGDLGEARLRDMDTQGVDKAVVSVTTPATQPLAPAEAVAIAREANDQAAAAVAAHPDRLAAFATLPTPDPEAAADELERSVTQLGLRGAMLRGNVAVTPSAMFDQRLLRRAIEVLGVDRILMSTDYPFQDAPKRNARAFLASSDLTIDDQERIGSRNAARLLGM